MADETTPAEAAPEPTFDEAVYAARNVMCGDMEGVFTCHTVDPYVDAMARAHEREVGDLRNEVSTLRKLLLGLKRIAHGVPADSPRTPWVANGSMVFPKTPYADHGDIIATFYEDAFSAADAAAVVNAFIEIRDNLDSKFRE